MSEVPRYARLSSPALIGHAVNSTADKSTSRVTALGMAATLGEVIEAVPVTYREALKPLLRKFSDSVVKSVGVRNAVAKLLTHKAKQTFPPQLQGCKLPVFELTKEYSESHASALSALAALHTTFRVQALDAAIEAKKAELEWWDAALAQGEALPPMRAAVDAVYAELQQTAREPVWADDGTGKQVIQSYKTSPWLRAEYNAMVADLPAYVTRAQVIEFSRSAAGEAKRKAKRDLKDAADVEMGDATTSTRTIQDIVSRQVAAALKDAGLGGKVSPTLFGDEAFSNRRTAQKRCIGRLYSQTEEGQDGRHETKRLRLEAAGREGVEEEGGGESQSRQEGRQRQRQREAEGVISAAEFRYDHPDSYPDDLLLIPTPLAIRYILSRADPSVVDAARYRAGVHLGPDVFVPRHLQIHLSAGLKYMFPTRVDYGELISVWHDFEDRLRWRLHWMTQEANNVIQERPYDHDYEIVRERQLSDFRLHYIEAGLAKGREFVSRYVENSAPKSNLTPARPELVQVAELQDHLRRNNYIVLPTDKNLGCAVVTRQWFIDGGISLLSDTRNYRELDSVEKDAIIGKTRTSVAEAATFVDEFLQHPQLANFLRSKIPEDAEADPVIPEFYVIPKIHKTPVKFRPIVPCHSAMQNPCAKYVSKALKPLLAERPYLLRGSKDLALKLKALRLPPGRKAWLVSGDIVAFYPNIPTDKCMNIVQRWYNEFTHETTSLAEKQLFGRCLRIALRNLITTFAGRTFLQTRGLAMGVACSPDLANLYGCFYEEKVLPDERIPFFGRFIDDVLGVVYANSAEEALTIASLISYEDVELEWSVSEWNTPFLDLLVYIDPVSGQVEHKPFRKARNHLERIPWTSHHPKDVKKGTFVGEMSRLAVLCSTPNAYLEAIDELRSLYIARGYPVNLVDAWLRDNTAKRWENRLGDPRKARDAFVLKSRFNQAWDGFNVHELGQTVVDSWLTWLTDNDIRMSRLAASSVVGGSKRVPSGEGSQRVPLIPSGGGILTETLVPLGKHFQFKPIIDVRKAGLVDRDWIVSRRRNRNLFDFVSMLRKFVVVHEENSGRGSSSHMDDWEQ